MTNTGSSPQVRGKLSISSMLSTSMRLIPAGAGKTFGALSRIWAVAAHPRRCGENFYNALDHIPNAGSSPQVRGKRSRRWVVSISHRLIPAGAGKTRLSCSITQVWTAHPRRCGENQLMYGFAEDITGSSPQVRGKLRRQSIPLPIVRLIPAGAGKTASLCRCTFLSPAHPRRCGENHYSHPIILECGGSSPQVRGKRSPILSNSLSLRLIPAGAGKTMAVFPAIYSLSAHPRRCGEN